MIAKTIRKRASGSSHSSEARAMTTSAESGERFSVQLEADEQGVLWLVDAERTRYQLAVVLHAGWRIVDATPGRARGARGARVWTGMGAVTKSDG
jgi:hypothetical protein